MIAADSYVEVTCAHYRSPILNLIELVISIGGLPKEIIFTVVGSLSWYGQARKLNFDN